jgi:hypothetical protein
MFRPSRNKLRRRIETCPEYGRAHVRPFLYENLACGYLLKLETRGSGSSPIGPEPLVEFEVNFEPRPIPISKACGLVWNCSDILPGNVRDILIEHDIVPGRRTYAAAARAMLVKLKV